MCELTKSILVITQGCADSVDPQLVSSRDVRTHKKIHSIIYITHQGWRGVLSSFPRHPPVDLARVGGSKDLCSCRGEYDGHACEHADGGKRGGVEEGEGGRRVGRGERGGVCGEEEGRGGGTKEEGGVRATYQ